MPEHTGTNPSPSSPPPPEWMRLDDPEAADAARERLRPKNRFRFLPSLRRRTSRVKQKVAGNNRDRENALQNPFASEADPEPSLAAADQLVQAVPEDAQEVTLDDHLLQPEVVHKDVYRWAVLYENQRGLTLFSTPYYSSLTLLPFDPPPYTLPTALPTSPFPFSLPFLRARRHLPKITRLFEYPLPDGTWQWVSQQWMIDMKGDQEGYEYNWMFRKGKWRPEPNGVSWVRRRRWVRLMVRRADQVCGREGGEEEGAPPSVVESEEGEGEGEGRNVRLEDVWRGDIEGDWERCRAVLKAVATDGKKIEMWRQWLSVDVPPGSPPQSPASLSFISRVIQAHSKPILYTFIFPDSRARFMALLGKAGLLPDLQAGLGLGLSGPASDSTSSILRGLGLEFWSYRNGLKEKVEAGEGETELSEIGQVDPEKEATEF